MTDTEIKELFEANGQFVTGKDYALIRAFEIIIRQQRTWVGLTPTDMEELSAAWWLPNENEMALIDWVEAKLRSKNEY